MLFIYFVLLTDKKKEKSTWRIIKKTGFYSLRIVIFYQIVD